MVACPEEIHFVLKKERKKENKEAFNWASIFLTHFKINSYIPQQFLQWMQMWKETLYGWLYAPFCIGIRNKIMEWW